MTDLTREELCWLWLVNEQAAGGPDLTAARKLERLIAAAGSRELDEREIRDVAVVHGKFQ